MNNKNKAIEEMARVLCDKCLEDGNPCGGAKHICITTRNTATTLYNAGYRKVNDDEVVISKQGLVDSAKLWVGIAKEVKDTNEEIRKETAREILQYIYEWAWDSNEIASQEVALFLAKEYGVEVEK